MLVYRHGKANRLSKTHSASTPELTVLWQVTIISTINRWKCKKQDSLLQWASSIFPRSYLWCGIRRIRFIWQLIIYVLFLLDFILLEKLSWLWKNRCKNINLETSQAKLLPKIVAVTFSIPKLINEWHLRTKAFILVKEFKNKPRTKTNLLSHGI